MYKERVIMKGVRRGSTRVSNLLINKRWRRKQGIPKRTHTNPIDKEAGDLFIKKFKESRRPNDKDKDNHLRDA
jgi:hypothetical protein